jgi:hypothetical protein
MGSDVALVTIATVGNTAAFAAPPIATQFMGEALYPAKLGTIVTGTR